MDIKWILNVTKLWSKEQFFCAITSKLFCVPRHETEAPKMTK